MNVTVRLFASYADKLGRSRLELEMPDSATVADVTRSISSLPGAATLPPSPLVAVNCSYADARTSLSDGDEVAFIPPVAGG
ncbi:MAG: molybdopterin converting factor subunit 1 [Gemmatimonadales bacterium]